MAKQRCFGTGDPLYEAYHDEEWGRPVAETPDEHELFERIALEGFQAGLSWITILRKRDAFRSAFLDFHPEAVAAFTEDDVTRLMNDASIVRNRLKITATISNARTLLGMHERGERLADVIAAHSPPARAHAPAPGEVPGSSPESVALSKDLLRRGFRFVGPTTMYAALQAIGAVDDHVAGCWLSNEAPEGDNA